VHIAEGFCTEVVSDYAASGFRYRLSVKLAHISTVVDLAAYSGA
jgi:hypothetical protein